jgi:hypothetical protein
MKYFIALKFFFLATACLFSQDTLLLLNGREFSIGQSLVTDGSITFEKLKAGKRVYPSRDWHAMPGKALVWKNDLIRGLRIGGWQGGSDFLTEQGETLSVKHRDVSVLTDSLLVFKGKRVLEGYPIPEGEGYRLARAAGEGQRKLSKAFSLRGEKGERVFYKQDTTSLTFFVPEADARAYVYGRRSARLYYRSTWSYLGGAASGLSGTFVHYFWAPLPAVAFALINYAIPPKMKPERTGPEDQEYLNHEWFVDGYQHQANQIKLTNSFVAGVPAFLASMAIRWSYYQYIY